ncbi:unnamed protein product [Mesocestoides corti]|uniref:Uncharacterized protein n=1 Tax=Mesocestoides corti TaxID=53468 RepID=A0A0R3UI98_MESCO|nr:unnamed protein product [Mesocestoides corti]
MVITFQKKVNLSQDRANQIVHKKGIDVRATPYSAPTMLTPGAPLHCALQALPGAGPQSDSTEKTRITKLKVETKVLLIDKEIFPFESRRCVREILEESSDDDRRKRIAKAALKDRRLIKVELSTGCKIELGGLTGAENCFRGLPRRRLNITGPSYVKIVHALTMLEEFFPRLMRDIICPYPLPAGTTTKYETVNRMASTAYYHINHQIGGTGLRGQLNDRPFLTCKQLRETLQGD